MLGWPLTHLAVWRVVAASLDRVGLVARLLHEIPCVGDKVI